MIATINVQTIKESKTNPRRTFDKALLEELTESVRAHGVLQPILVRPVGGNGTSHNYELVAGARRYRAAKAAGLVELPAYVRELSDKEVLEIQVIENLQRENLHPLEEAQGYEQLVKKHGYTAEELAGKVGKSKAYVYARLKLCELPAKAKTLLASGKLDASRALLVARIPIPKLAEKAAKEIAVQDYRWTGAPMSFRTAKKHIQDHYMRSLRGAAFNPKDAELVPAAGACGQCPKRTGNQPELFGDIKGADVCTDPACFNKKVEAAWAIAKAEAKEKGLKVLDGRSADNARNSPAYVQLNDQCYDDGKYRKWSTLTRGRDVEKVLARDTHGNVLTLVPRAAAVKAAHENGYLKKKTVKASSSDRAARERARRDAAVDRAILEAVAEKGGGAKMDAATWRVIARVVIRMAWHDTLKVVASRRDLLPKGKGRRPETVLAAQLKTMKLSEIKGLVFEVLCARGMGDEQLRGPVCKVAGVNDKAIRARVVKEFQAKSKTKAKTSPRRKAKAKPRRRRR